jgi:amino acid exporter
MGIANCVRFVGTIDDLCSCVDDHQNYRWDIFVLLAYNAFKSAAPRSDLTLKALLGGRRTPLGYAVRGYTVHMTNPKAVLAWVAIIALGLPPEAPLWVGLAIVFGCFGLSIVVHLTYALVFSTPVMSSLYLWARRGIQATLGVFFTFAGLKLLLSRP